MTKCMIVERHESQKTKENAQQRTLYLTERNNISYRVKFVAQISSKFQQIKLIMITY